MSQDKGYVEFSPFEYIKRLRLGQLTSLDPYKAGSDVLKPNSLTDKSNSVMYNIEQMQLKQL